DGAVESVIKTRATEGPFESLEDFCSRVDTRLTNKRAVESLVKAGAFDALGKEPAIQKRPRLLERVETALDAGAKHKESMDFAKTSLFGESEIRALTKISAGPTDSKTEWTESDLLANEKEVLGLYLSGHPLSRYKSEMACYTTTTIGRLPDSGIVRVAGH